VRPDPRRQAWFGRVIREVQRLNRKPSCTSRCMKHSILCCLTHAHRGLHLHSLGFSAPCTWEGGR